MCVALQTTPPYRLYSSTRRQANFSLFSRVCGDAAAATTLYVTTEYFTEIDFLAQTAAAAVFDLFSMRCWWYTYKHVYIIIL